MEEDEEKSDIIEFVGLAPKSYALRIRNKVTGKIEDKIKCKGITINNETQDKVTFDSLRDLAKGLMTKIEVPSIRFISHQRGIPMHTVEMIKNITKLDDTKRKGVFSPDGYLYPYGHADAGWTPKDVIQIIRAKVSAIEQEELYRKNNRFEWCKAIDYGYDYPHRIMHIIYSYGHHEFGIICMSAVNKGIVQQALEAMEMRTQIIDEHGHTTIKYPDDPSLTHRSLFGRK